MDARCTKISIKIQSIASSYIYTLSEATQTIINRVLSDSASSAVYTSEFKTTATKIYRHCCSHDTAFLKL